MPKWSCPNCGGGFPVPAAESCCPWCGKLIDGSHDPPSVHSVVRRESRSDSEGREDGLSWLPEWLQ